MRSAQELRAAADLLCSEIEENQILFSYYEFTKDEQLVIFEHFIEYLKAKKHSYTYTKFANFKNYESTLSFDYLDTTFMVIMSYRIGLWINIMQKDLPTIGITKGDKTNISFDPAQTEATLKLYLESCVFKNYLKKIA